MNRRWAKSLIFFLLCLSLAAVGCEKPDDPGSKPPQFSDQVERGTPAEQESQTSNKPSNSDPEPEEINSSYLPDGHPLKPYLEEFEGQTEFQADHCVAERCFARLFDLPETVELRTQGVFNPRDYFSLWYATKNKSFFKGKQVLDLGTGSGPLALIAANAGASRVVGTDINPAAVSNARVNAKRFGWEERIEIRQVSQSDPSAYSVVKPGERFDLIVSNPPWDDDEPNNIEEYSEKDPGFLFIKTMIQQLPKVLTPDGRMLLLYAEPEGMNALKVIVSETKLNANVLLEEGPEPLASHQVRPRFLDYGVAVPMIEIKLTN
jgi:SAM-dependent methyltransferase